MLRPRSMRVFGGFHAFPGGALHGDDYSEVALELSTLRPEEAEAQMGEEAGQFPALGFFVCALRELFEEVGILYADDNGRPADVSRDELRRARRRLLRGESSLPELVASMNLRLATHRLRFLARWIAPEGMPVRFDARFFVGPAAGDPDPNPDEVEGIDWKTPTQILALAEAGAIRLAPPTVATVGSLVRFASVEELLEGVPATVAAAKIVVHSGRVRRLVAPNPSIMTGPGTNTYLVGSRRLIIIDPGSMEEPHLGAIASAGEISTIVVTHGHVDHYSGALELAQRTGAQLAASERLRGTLARHAFGVPLSDGDTLEVEGCSLVVLDTPGHASDHICLWLEEEKALFSGDLVLGEGTSVISPPDGDLAAYLTSLERVLALRPRRLYPAHFDPRDDAEAWIAWYLEHRRERERQILSALAGGGRTIPEIVAQVYTNYPEALHAVAERSVLAHLIKLVSEGRVRETGGTYEPTQN